LFEPSVILSLQSDTLSDPSGNLSLGSDTLFEPSENLSLGSDIFVLFINYNVKLCRVKLAGLLFFVKNNAIITFLMHSGA
jgi:hypothetical protein